MVELVAQEPGDIQVEVVALWHTDLQVPPGQLVLVNEEHLKDQDYQPVPKEVDPQVHGAEHQVHEVGHQVQGVDPQVHGQG